MHSQTNLATVTMKAIQKLCRFSTPLFLASPSKTIPFHHHFTSSTQIEPQDSSSTPNTSNLTPEEITQINLLIPSLCSTNHLKEAADLITTALFTNPPLKSLSLSVFIHSLTIEPDLTQSMYFLNKVKYTPRTQSFLKPITKMLVFSYFQKGQPKRALKIFHWVSRSDFPCGSADLVALYALLVNGFCKYRMVLEALRVLRVMVSENLVVGDEVRMWVYRGLLWEARIREAQELNEALQSVGRGGEGNDIAVKLLDQMIANWTD